MKTIIASALIVVTSFIVGCSGAEGPSESGAANAQSSTSDVESVRYMYSCSGGNYPCSEAEAERIMSSPSYSKLTGRFVAEDGSQCTMYNCTLPNGATCMDR